MRKMLYLAEYRKNKQSFLGRSYSELILIAHQKLLDNWTVLPEEKIIITERSYSFADGTLVIANIVNEKEIVGKIEVAKPYIIKVFKDFATVIDRQRQQQEKIGQWKQSLEYQFQELQLRKQQIELEKEKLQEKRNQLLLLEAENRGNLIGTKQMTSSIKLLGEILTEANLVSDIQLKLALRTQTSYPDIKIGKILALKGWIKSDTADFFAQHWLSLLEKPEKQNYPLGFYFKESGIMNENQIEILLAEQKELELKLGELAVLKGWLNTKTLDYFLKNIYGEIDQKIQPLCF